MTNPSSKFKVQSSKSDNTAKESSSKTKPTNPSTRASTELSRMSSGSSTMAQLLARQKAPFIAPQKGQMVKGTITKLTASEILVDINAKSEAVVLEKDKRLLRTLLNKLKIGDTVEVSILNPESEFGNPVVSLRRFMGNIIWDQLLQYQKNKEALLVAVKEATRGGYLVDSQMGITGFLPNSQLVLTSALPLDQTGPQSLVGRSIKVYVLELQRETRKVIFSQKPALDVKDFEQATKDLKIGQKIDVVVSNVTPFGLFVSLPAGRQGLPNTPVDGLIHISEISWEKTENIAEKYSVGQDLQAQIIGIDFNSKRVDLSIKRLAPDPFVEKVKAYSKDQKVKGKVVNMVSSGVLIALENDVEGIIRRDKIPPTLSYSRGDEITATIAEIDTKRRRIVLVPVLKEKPIGYR